MTLLDFANRLPEDYSEEQFVDLLKEAVDLNAILEMSRSERDALFDAAQYLTDFLLLVREAKGEIQIHQGQPFIDYRGPFIPTVLTRPEGAPFDEAALTNFGVGEAARVFGEEEEG